MKIQFAFLSLFLATAHAGQEPKGLRGRAGDDQDVDLLGLGYTDTAVPNGSSATINCGSGSQCCATGTFVGSINHGYSSIGSGGCAGTTYNNASTGTCTSSSCSISCDGTCNVVVKAGSGGGDGGIPRSFGHPGGYQPDGAFNHHKSNRGMPDMGGMPGYNGSGMRDLPGVPGSVNGMPSNNGGNTPGPYYSGGDYGGSPQYQPRSSGGPRYSYPGTAGIHRKSGYSGGGGSGGASARINQGERHLLPPI